MRFLAIVTAIVATVASFAIVVIIRTAGPADANSTHQAVAQGARQTVKTKPVKETNPQKAPSKTKAKPVQLGIVSYNLPIFEQTTQIYPSLTGKYIGWGTPFPSSVVLQDHTLGTTTIIVLEPTNVNLARIAAGKENSYLATFAAAEKKLNLPIILSFAPEMNGDWYPWGAGHITPALYKKMFQRVHSVLLKDGAKHVTFMWQVDRIWRTTEALKLLWPGKAYVNLIGFDGQLSSQTATFTSLFGPTFTQVRAFTNTPVLLSEVGAKKSPKRPAQIKALFTGAKKDQMTGVVFFDVGNWNFDTDTATLAAIKAAAAPKG